MADSKRYNGSTWGHSLRKLTTATDTFTTLPVDIYADGNNATVGISGNTIQSGTPTPDNPIQPQGTGERTGNLCLVSQSNSITYDVFNNYTISNNTVTSTGQALLGFKCKVEPNTSYTISIKKNTSADLRIREYSSEPTDWATNFVIQSLNTNQTTAVITTTQDTKWVLIVFWFSTAGHTVYDIMLNSGSTPLPYEPWGIEIPISSANTTTPVYLGEVQSTRQIKKLLLTGEEEYIADTSYSRFITTFPNAKIEGLRLTQVYCTHFTSTYDGRPVSEVPNNSIYSSDIATNKFFIKTTDYTIAADFKSYLAQQYAAGTPVTVWYVLAEPETAVVNEPLMRIGDYADTVSGITIPTITGKDTFDAETTLKPSEVYLSYTGWHDAEVKEWDGSQWNK